LLGTSPSYSLSLVSSLPTYRLLSGLSTKTMEPLCSNKNEDEMHLVLTNISKRPNIRALLLAAAAFDCKSVLVVGQRQFDFEGADLPRQLKGANLPIIRFPKWQDLVDHLHEQSIRLVGVEIHPRAVNLEQYEGRGKLAFLMGNEGQGIHEKHMKACDDFVIISQFGAGTASLNVYCACSIVLERVSQCQRQRRIANLT
jgi:tRNA G18 (ribose-2'-O)-methylase SpoU